MLNLIFHSFLVPRISLSTSLEIPDKFFLLPFFKQKFVDFEVRKGVKIRNQYNQLQHLTQDTTGKVTNSQLDTINKSQEVSSFPACDHKAHIKLYSLCLLEKNGLFWKRGLFSNWYLVSSFNYRKYPLIWCYILPEVGKVATHSPAGICGLRKSRDDRISVLP